MKLHTLFFFCFVIVFFSIQAIHIDGSRDKTKTYGKVSALPVFTWIDEGSMEIVFPDGGKDLVVLWPAEKIGDVEVSCLHEGTLKGEFNSFVVVSGCLNQPLVSITIHSSRLLNSKMFIIRNGSTEEVESPYVNTEPQQDYDYEDQDDLSRRSKRSAFEDYIYEDYDEIEGDDIKDPPPKLQLNMKLGFEESLKKHLGSNEAAQKYAVEVFTHARSYMRDGSLGTSLYLNAVEAPKFVENKTWTASRSSLLDAKTTKVNEPVPIIYLCYAGENQDLLGVSLIRKGCDPLSGVGIIKWRENILLAANTMSHECGHLTGLQHDAAEDKKMSGGIPCHGTGLMSEMDPAERPNHFSTCNSERFKKWYHHYGKSCIKEISIPPNVKTCPYPLSPTIHPCRCKIDSDDKIYLVCESMNGYVLNKIAYSFQCNNQIHRLDINMMGEDLGCSLTAETMGSLQLEYFHLYNVSSINADIGSNAFSGSAQTIKEIKIENIPGSKSSGRTRTIRSAAFSDLVALENIEISDQFQALESKSFSNLPSLFNLKLKGIKLIGPKAFDNMEGLKTLDLTESSVETIKFEAFTNLPVLTKIKFNTGTLENLETKSFSELPSLQMIELGDNKITDLLPNTFNNLPKLSFVNLTRNQISQISSTFIKNTPRLSSIDLSHNLISSLPSHIFETLPSMTEIYLNDNKIASIQNDAFKNLPTLTLLDLSQNDFEEIGNNLENIKKENLIVNLSQTKLTLLYRDSFKGLLDIIGQGYIEMGSVELKCQCDIHWLYDQSNIRSINKFHNAVCEGGQQLEQVDSARLDRLCPSEDCPQITSSKGYVPTGCLNGVETMDMKIEGRSVEVSCDDAEDGNEAWVVIQRRGQYGNPQDHFSRAWTEYENGFGNPKEEVWLGLRNMAAMTREGEWELQVDLEDWDNKTYVAVYKKFSVGPGQEYQLHISGFDSSKSTLDGAGTQGLGYHNGKNFTTKDKDQDTKPNGNCAVSHGGGGGWWFGYCQHSCLNCLNYNTQCNDMKGIGWYHGGSRERNTWKTFKGSVMKIRKVNH